MKIHLDPSILRRGEIGVKRGLHRKNANIQVHLNDNGPPDVPWPPPEYEGPCISIPALGVADGCSDFTSARMPFGGKKTHIFHNRVRHRALQCCPLRSLKLVEDGEKDYIMLGSGASPLMVRSRCRTAPCSATQNAQKVAFF